MSDTIYIVSAADKSAANTAMGGEGNFSKGAALCRPPSTVVSHYAIATEIDLAGYLSDIESLEMLDGGNDNAAALSAAGYEPKTSTPE